jgi:hypothetical protein
MLEEQTLQVLLRSPHQFTIALELSVPITTPSRKTAILWWRLWQHPGQQLVALAASARRKLLQRTTHSSQLLATTTNSSSVDLIPFIAAG